MIDLARTLRAGIEAAGIEQRFYRRGLSGIFDGRRLLRHLLGSGHRRAGRCRTGTIGQHVTTRLAGHAAVWHHAFVIAVFRKVLVRALLLCLRAHIERLG